MNCTATVILSSALLLAPAAAGAVDRVRVVLNGARDSAALDFHGTRNFTEFAEQGTVETDYRSGPKPGLDVGIQFNYLKNVGMMVGYSLANRDETASYSAALPHPLYLNQPRRVSGEASHKYKERAGHFDLVVSGGPGSLRLIAFAGGTYFKVTADLVDQIQYTHTYPYDAVSVTGVPSVSTNGAAWGFNAGAGLDYKLGSHFGLGAQARFSRATVKLAPSTGNTVNLDVGGLQAAAGARIFF